MQAKRMDQFEKGPITFRTRAGVTYAAKWKSTGKVYAIKMRQKQEIIASKTVDHVLTERKHVGAFKSRFIEETYAAFGDSQYLYFVSEFIPGGDLFSLLAYRGVLELDEAAFMVAQITCGLDYLHKALHFVHRNVKPDNIQIQFNGHVKLCGFQLANKIESSELRYTLCGTPEYIAPEVILNKGYGFGVDWWAWGVVFYELLFGRGPFAFNDTMDVFGAILSNQIYYPSGQSFIPPVRKLIKKCLMVEPHTRFGALKTGVKELERNPVFKKINFDAMHEGELEAVCKPRMTDEEDMVCFENVPQDPMEEPAPIPKSNDPFADW